MLVWSGSGSGSGCVCNLCCRVEVHPDIPTFLPDSTLVSMERISLSTAQQSSLKAKVVTKLKEMDAYIGVFTFTCTP